MSLNPKPRLRLLSVDETALELNISTKTVRRLIERGELLVHRIGRCLRVREDDLLLYLRGSRA